MKFIFAIGFCLVSSVCLAQTYDLKEYPQGTSTIGSIRSRYTDTQIKDMLNSAEMYQNVDIKEKLGIVLTDTGTSEKMIICDTDSTILMFEYIKKLQQEIIALKSRLQSAGIP